MEIRGEASGRTQRAVSEEDLLFYREWKNLLLADVDVLGPAGQEAYQQMLATGDFTPHVRTDLVFQPAGEQ